jgi:unsaturated chondroitin disaccharide hydrolase
MTPAGRADRRGGSTDSCSAIATLAMTVRSNCRVGWAHYFLNRLPEDDVCHWDLALLGTDAVRDSSAAAIAVCGLLDLATTLPATDDLRACYEEMALRIMDSLTDNYLVHDEEDCDGLLKHSVYHMASGKGVDECCSWGDYFYVEALVRLTQCWQSYW